LQRFVVAEPVGDADRLVAVRTMLEHAAEPYVGAELQRLAVGINPGSSPLDNMDFSQLSSEDLEALRDGKPIKVEEKQ